MRRTVAVLAVASSAVVFLAQPAHAHGIGGRSDLPVPLLYFVVGAGVILVASFVALAVLWPDARLQDGPLHRPLFRAPWLAWVLGAVGLFMLWLVIVAGLFGANSSTNNIAPVTLWVGFWLVVPFLSAVIGNWYAALNPWRTMAVSLRARERPELLARFGVWPATVAFVAFVWFELVYRDSGFPSAIGTAAVLYTAYALLVAGLMGTDTGLQVGEPFTTYNRVISAIAPFGMVDGTVVWRGWLRALPVLPQWRGLSAFVVAMIGTVTYDGLSATPFWSDVWGSLADAVWFGTLALVAVVAIIGAAYWLACAAIARVGEGGHGAGDISAQFAHTLIPIALAYAVAHYFTLIVFEGQLFLATVSDPLGRGWDLFGTADWTINFSLISPVAVWYVQVAAIVLGHLLGVLLAHDRAISMFRGSVAVRTQYGMLVLMVALTGLGLAILAAG